MPDCLANRPQQMMSRSSLSMKDKLLLMKTSRIVTKTSRWKISYSFFFAGFARRCNASIILVNQYMFRKFRDILLKK